MRFIFQFKLASILEARSFHTRPKGIHSVAHDRAARLLNTAERGVLKGPARGASHFSGPRAVPLAAIALYSEDLFIFINQIASPSHSSIEYHTAAACALLYLPTHHVLSSTNTDTRIPRESYRTPHSCFAAVKACNSQTHKK